MTLYRNSSLGGFTTFQRFMMGKIIVYIGISGAQICPNFPPFPPQQDIGFRCDFSKRVLYIFFWPSQQITMERVGWLLFPFCLARQLLGEHRGVAQLAPPGRWDAGNDVDELRGTLGGGGAAAAYWRGGLYINGCQCEWHASWWLGKFRSFFLTHGSFFCWGGIFLNGGLVKQQFWFFLVSSLGLFLTFLLLFSCWSTPEMPWQLRLLRSQYQPCGWFEGALFRIAWTITPPKFNWHNPWRKRWERKMILSL